MDVFAAAYKDVFTAVAKKFTASGAGQSQMTLTGLATKFLVLASY
jgi:hypothetical protein